MIIIEEDIKTASQLKNVIEQAIVEYSKNNDILNIRIEGKTIVYNGVVGCPELVGLELNIDIDI